MPLRGRKGSQTGVREGVFRRPRPSAAITVRLPRPPPARPPGTCGSASAPWPGPARATATPPAGCRPVCRSTSSEQRRLDASATGGVQVRRLRPAGRPDPLPDPIAHATAERSAGVSPPGTSAGGGKCSGRSGPPRATMAACSRAFRSSRTFPGHARPLQVSRRRRRAAAAAAAEPPQEVLGQQRHVLRPVAQRRQVDLEDVQPEEQVVAEPAGGDAARAGRGAWPTGCRTLTVLRLRCRRPAAPRGAPARAAASPAPAAGCRPVRRGTTVPPSARASSPGRGPVGPGERPPDVAEQLALDEVRVQGGDVDREERLVAPAGCGRWTARATSSLPVPLSPVIEDARLGRRRPGRCA